jgi:hypothetical protein
MSLPQYEGCIQNVSDFLLGLTVYQRGRQRLFNGVDQLLLTVIGSKR